MLRTDTVKTQPSAVTRLAYIVEPAHRKEHTRHTQSVPLLSGRRCVKMREPEHKPLAVTHRDRTASALLHARCSTAARGRVTVLQIGQLSHASALRARGSSRRGGRRASRWTYGVSGQPPRDGGVARQAQSRSATRGGQPRCARAAQDLGAAYHTLSCRKGSASLCRWRRRATGQHGALSSGQSGGCAPSSEPAPQSRLPSSEARDKLVHDLTKALALDKGGRGAVEVAGDGQVRSVGILEVLLRL